MLLSAMLPERGGGVCSEPKPVFDVGAGPFSVEHAASAAQAIARPRPRFITTRPSFMTPWFVLFVTRNAVFSDPSHDPAENPPAENRCILYPVIRDFANGISAGPLLEPPRPRRVCAVPRGIGQERRVLTGHIDPIDLLAAAPVRAEG